MFTRNLRFYSAGQDGGGSVAPLGGSGEPLGGSRDAKPASGEEAPEIETPTDDQPSDRFARENQRKALEIKQLNNEKQELLDRLEALENSKLSEAEKLAKAQEKLQQKIAEAERKAKDAERKLFSSKAVLTHQLPEALSDLLTGETQEEVEQHAKLIATELDKWARSKYKPVAPNLEGGDRSKDGGATVLDEKTRAAKVRETAAAF